MLVTSILGLVAGGIVVYLIHTILKQPEEKLHTESVPVPSKEEPVAEVVPEITPEPTPAAPVEPEQTRDPLGRFVADNPSTPDVNEAWKGGKSPAKKTAKKAPAKPKQTKDTTAKESKAKKPKKIKVAK